MADAPPDGDGDEQTGVGPHAGSTAGTPRWVKVFALVVLAVVVLAVVMILSGRGGGHGPSRHALEAGTAAGHHTPPSAAERGEQEP